ncbi:hypothetical protein [Cereibacter sphaeroides]|nr:hypothetical protein [Cereibacter sphaeroides]
MIAPASGEDPGRADTAFNIRFNGPLQIVKARDPVRTMSRLAASR